MRAIVSAPDFLDGNYLSTDAARAGDAAADQRLQPAGDQRARRQHLGQLLVAVLQAAAVGRHDHGARPVHRRAAAATRCRRAGAATRAPPSLISLWSTAPFLLNNTVGTFEQRPVGRRAHAGVPGLDRADAVAGEARARPGARRQGAGRSIDRTTERSYVGSVPAASCRSRCGRCSAAHRPLLPWLFRQRRRHRDRPDPARACRSTCSPTCSRSPEAASLRRAPAARASKSSKLLIKAQARSRARCRPSASDERAARAAFAQPGTRAHAGAEQVPGLRGQSRPLLRHRHRSQSDGAASLSDDDKRALIEFLKTF